MSNPDPTAEIAAQYLAAREEEAQCRAYSEQYTTRADAASARAAAFASVITTLGGELPVYPPVTDADLAVDPDEDLPQGDPDLPRLETPDQTV